MSSQPNNSAPAFFSGRASTNALLALIAILAGLSILKPAPGAVSAAGPDTNSGTLVSAAEQRKAIIAELQAMNAKLAAIQAGMDDKAAD